MWPFRKTKKHLQYASVWEWQQGEGVPDKFITHKNPVRRDRWIMQYGELRRHLYQKHIKSLDTDEQQLIAENRHPSQSHRFADNALPYLDSLKQELDLIGLVYNSVELGMYHMDRIILSVDLDPVQQADPAGWPWLHRGFEVKY